MSFIRDVPGGRTWIKTELNDAHGEYDRQLHRDWCDDGTCWCRRGTSGGSERDTTPPGVSGAS